MKKNGVFVQTCVHTVEQGNSATVLAFFGCFRPFKVPVPSTVYSYFSLKIPSRTFISYNDISFMLLFILISEGGGGD